MIVARLSVEMRARVLFGMRRGLLPARTRKSTIAGVAASIATGALPVWPPPFELGPALIADRAAHARALRSEAISTAIRDCGRRLARLVPGYAAP